MATPIILNAAKFLAVLLPTSSEQSSATCSVPSYRDLALGLDTAGFGDLSIYCIPVIPPSVSTITNYNFNTINTGSGGGGGGSVPQQPTCLGNCLAVYA